MIIPESVTPAGLRARAGVVSREPVSTARHLELAAIEIERLRGALTKIANRWPCSTADDMSRVAGDALSRKSTG